MKKRFLSLFLAFVMVVCMLPLNTLTAFAATDPTTATELQSAINSGGIVKLGGDIDLGSTVLTFPDDTPVTIDLNGYNLHKPTASSYVMVIDSADTVTVKDSVGTGTVTKGSGWYFFHNSGNLKIKGGTFNKPGYDLVYTKDNAETEIFGGMFILSNIHARQSANATMTISGGIFDIETVATGLWDVGTTITGGTFTTTETDTGTYLSDNFVDLTKCNIAKNADNSYTISKIPVPIEVGDFTILGEKELVEGADYTYADGVLMITTATLVTVAMKNGVTTTDDTIVVDSSAGATYVTLNNIKIGTDNLGNSGTNTPITVKGANQVTLDFIGNNSLSSDVEGVYQQVYGISVESKTPFVLTSSNNGSLSIHNVGFAVYTNGYTAGGSTEINGSLQMDIKDCASHAIYSNGSGCGTLTISGTPVINIDTTEYAIYAFGINISGGKITIKSDKGYPVCDGSGTNIALSGSAELHIVEAKGGLRTNGGKVTITDNAKYKVYSTDADNNKIAYADGYPLISTGSSGEVEISKNAVVEVYSANDGISGGKTSILDNAQVDIVIDTDSTYSEYALSFDDTLTIANNATVDIDVIKGKKVRGLYDSSGTVNVTDNAVVTIDGTTYDGTYVNALNLSGKASVTVNAAGDNAIYGDIFVTDTATLTATSIDTRVIYDPCTVTPAADKVYMVKYGKTEDDTSAEYFTTVGTVDDKSTWRYFSVEVIDFVPVTEVSVEIDAPVKNGTPDTTAEIANDANYTVSAVTWNGNPSKFLGGTEYTATFTLTASNGFAFTSDTTVTVESAAVTKILNNDGTLSVTAKFPSTEAATPANITVKTKPTTVEYIYGDKFNPSGLVITVTNDDGTTSDITYSDTNKADFSFLPADLTPATTKITVTYAGKTADIAVKVNKANLTVTVDNKTATYGDGVPNYTVSYDGFITGDYVSDLGGTLAFDCDYAQFSDKGEYTIKASGYTSDNYNINYVDGKLTVSAKPITVTADAKSKTYGEGDPALTWSITSGALVNGEQLTGISISRVSGENANTYAITVGQAEGANKNYDITFVGGTFTINAKTVEATVVVNGAPFIYNGSKQEPEIVVKDGDTVIPANEYEVRYANNTNAGTATVTVTDKDGGNYVVNGSATFIINKADPAIGTVGVDGVIKDSTKPSEVVLTRTDTTVDGVLKLADDALLANKLTYRWVFTPTDTDNYNVINGDVQIDVLDTVLPTAVIKVENNDWKQFINNITFGLFFKETQKVTITAVDNENGSGIKDIVYFVSDCGYDADELRYVEWKSYTEAFNIEPDGKFVIYANVTDNDGNAVIINSDGVVLDKTAAVVSGITDGETYYGQLVFTAIDELTGMKSVVIDGNDKTHFESQYVINGDNAEHTVVVTDNAGNVTEYKVTVYKNYTVTYKADGEPISTETVGHGKDATLPAVPAKDGYVGKWDGDGKNITEDRTISVVYTEIPVVKPDEVKPEDKTDLEDTKKQLEEMLEDDSYTDDDKKDIQEAIDGIDDALEVIGNVEAVEELIDKLPDTIKKDDEAAIKAADDAYNALSNYEKSLVDEDAKKALEDAKADLAELNKPADTDKPVDTDKPADTDKPVDTDEPVDTDKLADTNKPVNSPQTGDNSNIWMWFAVAFISGSLLFGTTMLKKKEE